MHHTRRRSNHRLHLTQLHPLPTQLHLKIRTPQILDLPTNTPPHQITRPIQPRTPTTKRIRHKPLSTQPRTRRIPTRHLHTTQIQLTRHTRRHHTQPRIQHIRGGVADGLADGDVVASRHVDVRHVDRGFGGTVQIVNPGVRQLCVCLECHRGGQRLTGRQQPSQRPELCKALCRNHIEEHRQHRRHEMHRRRPRRPDQLRKIQRIRMTTRPRHHHLRTRHQRREQLRNRHIKRHRRLQHHPIGVGQ